jgi:protein-L-isoaspartate(D-aspartate) O-methyltransferase
MTYDLGAKTPMDTMVNNQIISRGVTHKATLAAMRKVARHQLVPEELRNQAYDDGPLPIGFGQTISQPYIVAYMTETIAPTKEFKVLEIGTGSGYQAAVLAEIVAQVYSVEIIPELGARAKSDLQKMGYKNIHIKIGDGFHGWAEYAPYDAIVVTAAAEYIPPPLIEQLKSGGKMIIPVGTPFWAQNLVLLEKIDSAIRTQNVLPVRFVPLTRTK